MEKKVLEMYVSPAQQVVELEVKTTLLSGSGFNPDDPKPGDDEEF